MILEVIVLELSLYNFKGDLFFIDKILPIIGDILIIITLFVLIRMIIVEMLF